MPTLQPAEDSRVVILMRAFFVPVSFVVFYHGYCKYCQKNLPDGMLRHDTNTILNQSCVIFITLVNMAYDESGCSLYPIYPFLE